MKEIISQSQRSLKEDTHTHIHTHDLFLYFFILEILFCLNSEISSLHIILLLPDRYITQKVVKMTTNYFGSYVSIISIWLSVTS